MIYTIFILFGLASYDGHVYPIGYYKTEKECTVSANKIDTKAYPVWYCQSANTKGKIVELKDK